jgi:hypothetical protein
MALALFPAPQGGGKTKRVELFNATGTWVAPARVTYAIATLVSGGGSGGLRNSTGGNTGGSSSAFGVSHEGGRGGGGNRGTFTISRNGKNAQANTGHGGTGATNSGSATNGADSYPKTFGSTVVPGTSYTITVGAGAAGVFVVDTTSGSGGSGYVQIEYWIG